MDKFAVFVDAGYLFAEGSKQYSQTGTRPVPRRSIQLDQEGAIETLLSTDFVVTKNADLLRIYWYDGVVGGQLSHQQLELAGRDDVKFRAGVVNPAGQQKGVDSMIVTDLIELSRNHAIADAILVSGDGDLRIGVQIAQSFGVRVHIVSIEPSGLFDQSRSMLLSQEADTTIEWSRVGVAGFLTVREGHEATVAGRDSEDGIDPSDGRILEGAVREVMARPIDGELSGHDLNQGIPKELDGQLLRACRGALGRDLDRQESSYMRKLFRSLASTDAS